MAHVTFMRLERRRSSDNSKPPDEQRSPRKPRPNRVLCTCTSVVAGPSQAVLGLLRGRDDRVQHDHHPVAHLVRAGRKRGHARLRPHCRRGLRSGYLSLVQRRVLRGGVQGS